MPVKLNKVKKLNRGFTLIELIVVVGVLAILGGMVMSVVDPFGQFQKANDGRRKSDLSQIQKSLEAYYQDAGKYPSSSADYQLSTIDASDPVKEWGTAWPPYINILPKDTGSKKYVYYSPASSNGQSYYLYASLERGSKDPQACNNGNACTSLSGAGFPPSSACGGTCNYGVSSPNVAP